jgi:hypothetical protein
LTFHSGRETDHSPPSSAEVKEWVELYVHSPNTPSWRGVQLGGAQGTTLHTYARNICIFMFFTVSSYYAWVSLVASFLEAFWQEMWIHFQLHQCCLHIRSISLV